MRALLTPMRLRKCYNPRMAPPTFVRQTVRDMDGYTPGEQPGMGERVALNTVYKASRKVGPEASNTHTA